MTKIDLDDLERKARAAEQDEWRWRPGEDDVLEGVHNGQVVLHPATVGHTIPSEIIASTSDRAHIAASSPPVVLALIARVRMLEDFLEAMPDAGLQPDKVYREDYPELFTDKDRNALYMDEARRRILERGVVLP